MIRKFTSSACFLLLSVTVSWAQVGAKQRLEFYKDKLISKGAIAGTLGSAVWGEARNTPSEWGRTTGGFFKRWGSAYAQNGVYQTISLGVSAAHHEDLRYKKSNSSRDVSPRALRREAHVHRALQQSRGIHARPGRIAGAFGAGPIARSWKPASTSSVGDGFESAGISLGISAGLNVVRGVLAEEEIEAGLNRPRPHQLALTIYVTLASPYPDRREPVLELAGAVELRVYRELTVRAYVAKAVPEAHPRPPV